MKTISFLLFFLLANMTFSQENASKATNVACGDSITKLLHMLVTEADALYELGKFQSALEKYKRYCELHKANEHVNDRIQAIQKVLSERASGCGDYEYQLEKLRSFAWKQYQLGNCGKALEVYRRMKLLSPGNEEANSCYAEIAEKIRPDTADLRVRCEPEPLEQTPEGALYFGFRLTDAVLSEKSAEAIIPRGLQSSLDSMLCANRGTFLLNGRLPEEPEPLQPLDKNVDSTILVAQKLLEATSCRIGIVEKADRLYEAGNYLKALDYYERSLFFVSSNGHVQNRIADIRKKLGVVDVHVLQLPFPQVLPVPVNRNFE